MKSLIALAASWVLLATLLPSGVASATGVLPAPFVPRPQTVVSLTFDDATADQMTAASILNTFNIDGTFFVVSGYIGAPGHLTQSNLTTLTRAGHEIGGHTVSHADLTTLPLDEARRQICADRATLAGWGFPTRSFAYPFAATNDAIEAAAAECGYNSARMLGDVKSRFGCPDCDYAETVPPTDAFYTRALDQVDSSWTLADLKSAVTNGERTGGWVQLTFHRVCASGCGALSVTPLTLSLFTAWLATRAITMNTITRPVGVVVGGAVKPVVAAPPASSSGVQNGGLESLRPDGTPECWSAVQYGANTASFATVSPGHSGNVASKVTMTGYASGDAKVLPSFDLGTCAPAAAAGTAYGLRAWYTSTTATQFTVYLRTSTGAWQYWTSSPWFAAAPAWSEAAWTTPAVPAGFTGISFGLNIFSNGELVTDDYSLSPAP